MEPFTSACLAFVDLFIFFFCGITYHFYCYYFSAIFIFWFLHSTHMKDDCYLESWCLNSLIKIFHESLFDIPIFCGKENNLVTIHLIIEIQDWFLSPILCLGIYCSWLIKEWRTPLHYFSHPSNILYYLYT